MLSTIKSSYEKLTPTGKRLADVALSRPKEVSEMSIQQYAEAAGVAPSAVIRFCRVLELDGFSEFKRQLTALLSVRATREELPAIERGAPPAAVFRSVFGSGIRALEDTLRLIDPDTVDRICRCFKEAKRIFFLGVGTSSVVATDAHYRFSQLGLSAQSCTDIVFMNVTALNMKKGDVAVGISHSGRTKATVDAMHRAKESGAVTVAITSFKDSPLARMCDHVTVAFADEESYPIEAVSARLAHICMIDAFMMALATMDYDALPEHLGGRNAILRDIRYP